MSIRKITLNKRTQSVKHWSIELDIPTKTIYQRLRLDWPPELILNKKFFNYKTALKAAEAVEQREGYPTKTYRSALNFCCIDGSMCEHAIALNKWEDISNDPSEVHYYCKMLREFVWGEDPKCV